MPSLRQRLQNGSPELFAALQRSWEIAQKEWLPAVIPSEGSYNSLPHFTNVEQHLDALLGPAADSPATTLRLTTLETYLLLAGVLFHDFGRVYGDTDHASASARALPQHFSSLGIPTFELASSLSRIALYHDPLTTQDKISKAAKHKKLAYAKAALREVRIEPFGTARELYVGTLLALADHMDGSAKRAEPRYVAADDEIGFKGAFRRLVSGTGYDPATYTIKTCLNGFPHATDDNRISFAFSEIYKQFLCWDKRLNPDPPDSEKQNISDFDASLASETCALYTYLLQICCPDFSQKYPSRMFWKCLAAAHKQGPLYLIGRKVKAKSLWPMDYLLAIVLNDLGNNTSFLKDIQYELDEMGLPVQGWFIEFGSEVFDERGEWINEPALQIDFLKRVAEEMWMLGCRLMVGGFVTYEVLADSLRIENVALVRLAVQRIVRVVFKYRDHKAADIIAGTSGWHWVKGPKGWNQKHVMTAINTALDGRQSAIRESTYE